MSRLTREEILSLEDIETKEVEVPAHIRGWGGRTLLIKQLSRGKQDEYLRRQFGAVRMRQDSRAKQQELTAANIYGHDAWICAQGIVGDDGKPMFTDKDIEVLKERNGEAIGWIAKQIVEFSGMKEEVDQVKALENAEEEVKN